MPFFVCLPACLLGWLALNAVIGQVQPGDRADNVPDVWLQWSARDAPADPGSHAAAGVPVTDAGMAPEIYEVLVNEVVWGEES